MPARTDAVFDAYDLEVAVLPSWYERLTRPLVFPGLTTSLGIVFWGKPEHIPAVTEAVKRLEKAGVPRFSALREALRTPSRLSKFAERTGIDARILRVFSHDLGLWLPVPLPLGAFELFTANPGFLGALERDGVRTQLDLVSSGRTAGDRRALAAKAGVPAELADDAVRLCDFHRMGDSLDHIRSRLYFDMGMDTFRKWAEAEPEAVIARFREYVRQRGLESIRLVPWPKEVRNAVEWAKVHLELFEVEWR